MDRQTLTVGVNRFLQFADVIRDIEDRIQNAGPEFELIELGDRIEFLMDSARESYYRTVKGIKPYDDHNLTAAEAQELIHDVGVPGNRETGTVSY